MAQSQVERVTMLERRVDVHGAHIDTIKARVNEVDNLHVDVTKELVVLEREVALLKRELEELKKGHEEWGRKLWMIVPPVLAVLISTALTFVITLSLKK